MLLEGLRAMRDAGKGVVMLKVGATEAGARASAAHTGALADDDDVVNAALDAYGAVRVTGFDDLIETAGLLGAHGPAASPAIGIVLDLRRRRGRRHRGRRARGARAARPGRVDPRPARRGAAPTSRRSPTPPT